MNTPERASALRLGVGRLAAPNSSMPRVTECSHMLAAFCWGSAGALRLGLGRLVAPNSSMPRVVECSHMLAVPDSGQHALSGSHRLMACVVVLLMVLAGNAVAEPVYSIDPVWRLGTAGQPPVLELNLLVQRASLTWRTRIEGLEGGWEGRLFVEQGGQALMDTVWRRTDWRARDSVVGAAEMIPDQLLLAAPAGGGRLRVQLMDLAGGPALEKSLRLLAADESAALGGFSLGLSEPAAANAGPFMRGGWRFLPYADALYGSGLDTLRGLLDVRAPGSPDSITLELAILGERRNRLESRMPRPLTGFRHLPGDPMLVSFSLPVGHLPSGAYLVEARLMAAARELGRQQKPFWVLNPHVPAPARAPEGDSYAQATAEDLARQWEAAQVLASHYEQEAWERLDLEGRRAFLREFWQGRDPDPGTLVNEEQLALLSRIEEARRRWPARSGDKGLGDRARTFVRHGPPDAIETDFGQLNARFGYQLESSGSYTGSGHREFELWIYNRIEGGVEFIFIDLQGFGTFELVHSTRSGEYFDPQWSRKLFP